MAKRIIKKNKEFRHEGVNLTVVSERDVDDLRQVGTLHALGDEVHFEAKDGIYVHGPRKWVCVGQNQANRFRVTHNIQTGEYRIAKTFTLADLRTLSSRKINELEQMFGELVTNHIKK